jgi:uncharacterized damage-inducible protein DinB
MDPVVSAFASVMAINDRLVACSLDGLTDEEAWKHPGEANPIHWLVGHITRYRNAIASTCGVGLDLPWASAFEMKTQPDPTHPAVSLADMRAAFTALSERLSKRFRELTAVDLSAAAPFKLRVPDQTMRGFITFMTFHEVYHVGQIAYVKKWLGYPGVVDGQ